MYFSVAHLTDQSKDCTRLFTKKRTKAPSLPPGKFPLRLGTKILDGLCCKLCGTGAAGRIDILGHAVACGVHLPQALQDLLGAGVIMVGDVLLQPGCQRLGLRAIRILQTEPSAQPRPVLPGPPADLPPGAHTPGRHRWRPSGALPPQRNAASRSYPMI